MLARKFVIILTLTATLFAWTADHILAAYSYKECDGCCTVNCWCSKPARNSCDKKAQVKKSSCDHPYSQPEKTQATLPKSVKANYREHREKQTVEFAVMPPNVRLTLASFSYYLEYTGKTKNLLPYTGHFEYRAPPA